jgi:Tol biopolymer transport system component
MHWSPDGRRLLVVRDHDGYYGGRQVGLLDPATGDIQPVGSVTGGTTSTAIWLPSD